LECFESSLLIDLFFQTEKYVFGRETSAL